MKSIEFINRYELYLVEISEVVKAELLPMRNLGHLEGKWW
jgi:hypothetical protein